jgi:hypothetical protein
MQGLVSTACLLALRNHARRVRLLILRLFLDTSLQIQLKNCYLKPTKKEWAAIGPTADSREWPLVGFVEHQCR